MIAKLHAERTGVAVGDFDVISGLSGIGTYLHSRLDSGEARATLLDLVRALVELSQEDDGLPRWRTPARLASRSDFMLKQFPTGFLNAGLAHGIPGHY